MTPEQINEAIRKATVNDQSSSERFAIIDTAKLAALLDEPPKTRGGALANRLCTTNGIYVLFRGSVASCCDSPPEAIRVCERCRADFAAEVDALCVEVAKDALEAVAVQFSSTGHVTAAGRIRTFAATYDATAGKE